MMGGLHIEMAALRMLGHWLEGSGWVQCLLNTGVATAGIADSFIQASYVKRTRYAHIVTAASLYIYLYSIAIPNIVRGIPRRIVRLLNNGD